MQIKVGIGVVFLAAATVAGPAPAAAAALELKQALLGHGPWPAGSGRDASNRVSGQTAAVEFGYRMFREPRMSANGYIACISCHQTDRAFTDAIPRAQGLAPVGRNTPMLANLRDLPWYGWDGASDSLWMASLRPMLDAREFGSDPARVAHVVRVGDGLACRYRQAFGSSAGSHDDVTVMVNVAKAIAAFVETLNTGRTPFDEFRDALASGDVARAARYPLAAQRGALLFVGKGGCAACHAGPHFSDAAFHRSGSIRSPGGDLADDGRPGGLAEWRRSPYKRLGRFSDLAPSARPEPARLHESAPAARHGHFRTPPLRNVALTPPYMHDGSVNTLFEAVGHPAVPGTQLGPLPAAAVSEDKRADKRADDKHDDDQRDLVAFLETLTDGLGAARRFPPRPPSPCP